MLRWFLQRAKFQDPFFLPYMWFKSHKRCRVAFSLLCVRRCFLFVECCLENQCVLFVLTFVFIAFNFLATISWLCCCSSVIVRFSASFVWRSIAFCFFVVCVSDHGLNLTFNPDWNNSRYRSRLLHKAIVLIFSPQDQPTLPSHTVLFEIRRRLLTTVPKQQ